MTCSSPSPPGRTPQATVVPVNIAADPVEPTVWWSGDPSGRQVRLRALDSADVIVPVHGAG